MSLGCYTAVSNSPPPPQQPTPVVRYLLDRRRMFGEVPACVSVMYGATVASHYGRRVQVRVLRAVIVVENVNSK